MRSTFAISFQQCRARPAIGLTRYNFRFETRRAKHKRNLPPPEPELDSRWLSNIKLRLGRCLTFGLNQEQKLEAGAILQKIAKEWRELIAGSQGYLTTPNHRGLYRYPIAWGEQDPFGHINNIVYNRWAESGRIKWTRNHADYLDPEHADWWRQLMIPKGDGLILRKITTKYKFPLVFPDRISVYHKLCIEPDKSDAIILNCIILSDIRQRIAAETREDIALYDYDRGTKINKHPWLLELLQNTWKLQQEAEEMSIQHIRLLLKRVRQLELDSWDNDDAVEDMGNAST